MTSVTLGGRPTAPRAAAAPHTTTAPCVAAAASTAAAPTAAAPTAPVPTTATPTAPAPTLAQEWKLFCCSRPTSRLVHPCAALTLQRIFVVQLAFRGTRACAWSLSRATGLKVIIDQETVHTGATAWAVDKVRERFMRRVVWRSVCRGLRPGALRWHRKLARLSGVTAKEACSG